MAAVLRRSPVRPGDGFGRHDGAGWTEIEMTYDLLIKGGTLMDGTGRAAFDGDVPIAGGVIASGVLLLEDGELHPLSPGRILRRKVN